MSGLRKWTERETYAIGLGLLSTMMHSCGAFEDAKGAVLRRDDLLAGTYAFSAVGFGVAAMLLFLMLNRRMR